MKNLSELKDEELVIKYLKEGDEDFFIELVNRYLKHTYNFVRRFGGDEKDAEEITQDSFVKLWKNIRKFREGEKFKTWFFTIARNTAIDSLRKKKHIVFSNFENENGENLMEDTLESDEILADKIAELSENKMMLEMLLDDLPPDYKEVLYLYYNEGLTMDEISKILRKPINTIKSQHRRALINLRKHANAPKLNH